MDDAQLVRLTQELVRTPSTSFGEEKIAQRLSAEMRPIFDTVEVDELSNVIGVLHGDEPGPCVLFNAHIDHVDTGAMDDPYSGHILGGSIVGGLPGKSIYGRGACDNKGGLAAMIAAAHDLHQRGFRGTLVLTAVVQEETGTGAGTIAATTRLREQGINPDVAVSAEATDGCVGLGHRGKVEFAVESIGRTAHASNSSVGVNAVALMAHLIDALSRLPAPDHPVVGRCTSAITLISCSPGRSGIVPDRCQLVFDNRYVPGESPERPERDVRELLEELQLSLPSFEYVMDVRNVMPPYLMSSADPLVVTMRAAIQSITGSNPQDRSWKFGTDGTYLMNEFGIPTVGFGPGHERFAHTPQEHVPIGDLHTARRVYRRFVEIYAARGDHSGNSVNDQTMLAG